jgi:hypothetical protein
VSIVVLLILAIVWAVVLGPSLLRRTAERRSGDSIGAFHRQLRVLERTGPVTVTPAHRLATSYPSRSPFRLAGAHAGATVVATERRSPSGRHLERPAGVGARRPDPYFRAGMCRRRRRIVLVLMGLLVGTGLLGAVPALRPALFVTLSGAVLLAVYVGLLVYLRTLALEREVKLRYLPQALEPEAPAAVRRVAAR